MLDRSYFLIVWKLWLFVKVILYHIFSRNAGRLIHPPKLSVHGVLTITRLPSLRHARSLLVRHRTWRFTTIGGLIVNWGCSMCFYCPSTIAWLSKAPWRRHREDLYVSNLDSARENFMAYTPGHSDFVRFPSSAGHPGWAQRDGVIDFFVIGSTYLATLNFQWPDAKGDIMRWRFSYYSISAPSVWGGERARKGLFKRPFLTSWQPLDWSGALLQFSSFAADSSWSKMIRWKSLGPSCVDDLVRSKNRCTV